MNPNIFIGLLLPVFLFIYFYGKIKSKKWRIPNTPFPNDWRKILVKEISFYNSLSAKDKLKFEYQIHEFLLNCKITGVDTKVERIDSLMVASSAVIPVFGFDNWKYSNIHEVLLYPTSFNRRFETTGPNRNILGMVGFDFMEGKMLLSRQALRGGFRNESDKKNTAIHEFVHLIDKSDGAVDGVPELLLEKQYTIPWLELINKKIDEIYEDESDINPYGGTNRAEFFSVVSEYFFERPNLLKKKHPQLYELLEKIFNQDMTKRDLKTIDIEVGRNSPCPCNSGKKYKKCCGKAA